MTVSDSIKSVFQSVDFKSRVEDALMYIPEIKLEPHLNNLLGIELKKKEYNYRREKTYNISKPK